MRKYIITMFLTAVTCSSVFAQQQISVSYDKTVHLIFQNRIMYVDLGSESIMASVIDNLPNILRIKAAERNFRGETNMSVILEGNRLFSFNIIYSDTLYSATYHPDIENVKIDQKDNECIRIFQNNLSRIGNIGYIEQGITVLIKGIFTTEKNVFIHIEILNKSNILYSLDDISFSIGNRRNKFSSEDMIIIERYVPDTEIDSRGSSHMVYMFDRFTLKNSDALQIMVIEKTGNRNISFSVDGKLFTRAIRKL